MNEFGSNQDLPILDELGAGLAAAFRREERVERRSRRRLRRLAIATAAFFVIVPSSVVATRSIWGARVPPVAPNASVEMPRAVRIAEGRGAVVRWQLSAYPSDRGVCHLLTTSSPEQPSSTGGGACRGELPKEWEITMGSSGVPGETVVDGWASPRVASVIVEIGGRPRTEATIVGPSREAAERARLPLDVRFYVATVPGDFEPGERTFRVLALDSSGREIDRREVPVTPPRPKR